MAVVYPYKFSVCAKKIPAFRKENPTPASLSNFVDESLESGCEVGRCVGTDSVVIHDKHLGRLVGKMFLTGEAHQFIEIIIVLEFRHHTAEQTR